MLVRCPTTCVGLSPQLPCHDVCQRALKPCCCCCLLPLQPCARNLITLQAASTDATQCINPTGYCYTPNGATPCPVGSHTAQGERECCCCRCCSFVLQAHRQPCSFVVHSGSQAKLNHVFMAGHALVSSTQCLLPPAAAAAVLCKFRQPSALCTVDPRQNLIMCSGQVTLLSAARNASYRLYACLCCCCALQCQAA
jgi:hypothetical protein